MQFLLIETCQAQENVFNTERNMHHQSLLKLEYTQQQFETSRNDDDAK